LTGICWNAIIAFHTNKLPSDLVRMHSTNTPNDTIEIQPHDWEERCDCGKLLLKKTKKGFELKCSRCKRIHLIPFDQIDEEYQKLCPLLIRKD